MSGCNWTSNWMKYYQHVKLPGYRHRIHIPVFRIKEFVYTVLGIPMCPECVAIPFMMGQSQVGLFLAVYSDRMTESYFDTSRWLSGKVKIREQDSIEKMNVQVQEVRKLSSATQRRRKSRKYAT